MYKQGKTSPLVTIGIILVVGYFLMQSGMLTDLFSTSNDVNNLYPATLKTAVTLNAGDKLATTATNVNASYYVFTSSGNYLKEGTLSSGTGSFEVPTGGNYKVILFSDTGTTDYNPIEVSFSTDGDDPTGRAVKTVNVDLYAESNATIDLVRDPVDLDGNITTTAGGTVKFDILYSATTSNAAVNKPIIQLDVNSSCVDQDQVALAGLSKVDCPDRLSEGAYRNHVCFDTGKERVASQDGIQIVSGSLKVNSATNCPTADYISIKVLDTGIYKEADYKTQGYSAFKYNTENPISDADIGATDSWAASSSDHANEKNYLYIQNN